MKEKTPLSHEVVLCFQMLDVETSKYKVSKIKFVKNYFFLEITLLKRELFLTVFLLFQPLPITRYQVRYAYNYLSNYQ